ncbi:MAG: diguanylate cyclase domain-containing protein [Angustibacter sp.]
MQRLVRRMAAVLDVTDTAGAARLGAGFLVFEGLVVATTGWWLHARAGAATAPVAVGLCQVAGGLGVRALPWQRWPRRSITAVPLVAICLLAGLAFGAPGAAAPYVGLLARWFLFTGLAAPAGPSLTLLMPAVSAYLLMLGELDARHLVRGGLAGCTWVVIAEAMAARAAFSSGRTAALERQAETDALTGVLNRRGLDTALSAAGAGDGVVVIDLDHFKRVNDRHGHAYGDTVLVDFARVLRDAVRSGDVVARLGGEEFVLVLRHAASPTVATAVLQRVRESWHRTGHDVTWSAGTAVVAPSDDPYDTLRRADGALYAAKAAGRNRVVTDAAPHLDAALPPAQRVTGSSPQAVATTTSS